MESTAPTDHPRATEAVGADVAVVGGGIAGLCTAWEMARDGRSVVVLEADRIAAGVTGHTTAKLCAQHTLIYGHVRKSFGADAAALYARSQQDAVEHVEAVSQSLGIDCQFERAPAYTYTGSADRVEEFRDEAEAAKDAGLAASFTTDTHLPFPVAAAVRVEGQAQFHPRRYLLALAEDLLRRGGRIFERTRVVGLHEAAPCRLTTDDGVEITAGTVVVATHYPVFDRAMLFSRLIPRRELVVAAPIPADRDPRGMYITPDEATRSVRTAPYGEGRRLLIVTGETFRPGTEEVAERFERLAAWTKERFGVDEITHRWAAQDNISTDRLPYIGHFHPRAEHVYVATGFNGWGMSSGVLAGRLLRELVRGDRPPWASVYDPRRINPTVETAELLKAGAAVARHFVGDRLHPAHIESVDDIPPGGGAVVRLSGDRCAVHRDENGDLHAVSAICTHLRCVVAYNDAERTWDCPCHGSRFGVDGAVLHGPATKPLERRGIRPRHTTPSPPPESGSGSDSG
ncbi:FAD-dependent oxidoreductase [Wenjunlia tyrosinilytica]|nr:FAD-dependent oxidoreductase [Wenjunlia tyrosinilytica]